ncbi:flagellar hook capping FlgD N-terminal domain-containing protein [Roseovarius sp. 2305UL8-3]|uniref:flagellar hook capping FlgD N-terminal domain-containing protein n=1 Tax=Roseovarius conchicola TaxID=3121636 RepID=UPI0035274190
MEIAPSFQSSTAASDASPGVSQNGSALSSDFETFIKMLTVQMQNQDPLNPIESADFAVQLATFSTVEQQVQTNVLLADLGNQIGALSVAQLSGWVGMDARVEMAVEFVDDPVTVTLRNSDLADSAQLVVRNAQGNEIQRLDVPVEDSDYVWTGTDSFGDPLPAGTYIITTESFSQGELIAANPVEVHGRIVEARNDNGQPVLVLEGGQEVGAGQILGLREPSD